jgi:hypothetical protein
LAAGVQGAGADLVVQALVGHGDDELRAPSAVLGQLVAGEGAAA